MAEMTREQKIARAEKLQKAQAIYDAQAPEAGLEEAPNPIGMLKNKLQLALRGADYARGNITAPLLANAMGVDKPEDLQKARTLQESYPGVGELLKRKGVLNEHPVARELLGVGGDMAIDPMTYASMGASALAKVKDAGMLAKLGGGALNPLAKMAELRGNGLYKKAFEELDQKALERGKNMLPSKVLQDARFSGGMGAAADTLGQVNEKAGNDIGSILTDASNKGATVDMEHVFEPALEEVKKLRKMLSPEAHDLANKIEGRVNYMRNQTKSPAFWAEYGSAEPRGTVNTDPARTLPPRDNVIPISDNIPETTPRVLGEGTSKRLQDVRPSESGRTFEYFPLDYGEIPVDAANREKSFLDNLIKDSGFDQGSEAALATKGRKAVAGSLRKGIPEAVSSVDKSLGERLNDANQAFSATDSSIQDKASNIAKRVKERTNILIPTWGDIMAAGAGGGVGAAMGDPALGGIAALALKKGTQAATSTAGRTARGLVATKLGNSYGLLDPLARRSVWSLMQDYKNGEDDNGN